MKTRVLPLTLIGCVALGGPVALANYGHAEDHDPQARSRLVQIVRDATQQYLDASAATAAGYGPFLGCVSGPDHGAMGIHYVSHNLFVDGQLDAAHPEALIYEPRGNRLRLVGVEFLVDAETWLAAHGAPPVIEGQLFHLETSPNRYNLRSFFALHVWAWRENPLGTFVDWNDNVSCDGEPGDPADPGGDH